MPGCGGFAEGLNAGLDAAGFPFCKGGVMARNPLWRKRLAEWDAQFRLWAERRSGAAVLFADIAFDFRGAAVVGTDGTITAGSGEAPALRRRLSATLAAVPALLAALAAQGESLGVGLTLFGGFRDDEPGPGTRTDLKLHGLMPLVAAVRLAALRAGVEETGTPARIAALEAAGHIAPSEAEALRAAFAVLLARLLRRQLADAAAGLTPGSLVDTDALPRAERAALRAALRAVRSHAKGVFAEFSGRVW